ncbi:MAG: HEAT repeat domain-containing protein [Planctomycetota bacterium]
MRVGGALLCFALLAAAQEVEARLAWRAGTVGQHNPSRIDLVRIPPEGVELPTELPEGVLFARMPIGNRATLTLVVGAEEFWIDGDLDGDLKETKPSKWFWGKQRLYHSVYVKVPMEGEKEPLRVSLLLHHTPDREPAQVEVTAQAYRVGGVVLGGRLRKVALVDGDGDLRFESPDDDRLYVDLDGDGQIELKGISHEELRAGLPFHLRGKGYLASIPEVGGGRVLFREVTPAPPPARRPWAKKKRVAAGARAGGKGDLKALESQYRKARAPGFAARSRLRPVQRIGRVGTPEAYALLRTISKSDPDPGVRVAAVQAMGYLEYVDRAAGVASVAEKAKDPTLQIAAIRALHGMGAPDREELYLRILRKTRKEPVFRAAAEYLAYVGTNEARRALLSVVERSSRVSQRYFAYYYGTRYFGRPPPPEMMRAAARSADERLIALAMHDLRYFGLREARALALEAARRKVRSLDLAMAITEILATEGDSESIDVLLPLADRESITLQERMIELCGPIRDPGGIAALARGLNAKAAIVRLIPARVLAKFPSPEVTDALAAQLAKEKESAVAIELIRSIAAHGGQRGAESIVAAAQRLSRNTDLRRPLLRALADIGMENAAVREYFLRALDSPRWEERILAIDAAAREKAASLAPGVIANLDHRVWQVRLAAIEALRSIRIKEGVDPLIVRLEKESEPRLRRAVAETLHRITGQNFYEDPALWRRFWDSNRSTFKVQPEATQKKARKPGTKTVATFYGLPVESERIVFVIDQSGSMGSRSRDKTELEVAVDETLGVIKRLPSRARVNVIFFESDIHPWRKALVALSSKKRASLKTHLRAQRPQGGTNLFDALELALKNEGVDTIFLLSDGMPGSGKYVNTPDIVREVRKINELRRITIHCVSIGRNSSLLRLLADQNGGRFTQR